MNVQFPLRFDGGARVVTARFDDHVEQLIEQVLFTSPGERVNRPDFGCGLTRFVFEPLAADVLTATEAFVKSALLRWLADVIRIGDVTITVDGSKLRILVTYVITATSVRRTSAFDLEVAS